MQAALSVLWKFDLSGKESTICSAGGPSWIPGSGRFPEERIGSPLPYSWASLVAQLVKNPPAMRDTWVRSLGWEDTLEKGQATHCSILAWRTPWTEELDRLQSIRLQRVGHNWASKQTHRAFIYLRHALSLASHKKKCKKAEWLSEEVLNITETEEMGRTHRKTIQKRS